jgi:RNA polymerase sigma-32 factor
VHEKVDAFKKTLSARELEIFELRIYSDEPLTLQEIGEKYDISRERVRQVEKSITKRLKDFFKKEVPDFYLYSDLNE